VSALDLAEIAGGGALVAATLYDLFQSVVLPRPSIGKLSPSRPLLRRLWRVWRWIGTRPASQARRESVLAIYGPLSVLVRLIGWVGLLVVGFGLILHALRGQIGPRPPDIGSAFYFSGISMLTVGYGDYYPIGSAVRIVVVIEAATGFGLIALVISLLFWLYPAFQRREVAVVALDASAGAPPSGIHLLETCAELQMPEYLEQVFSDWRTWAADVLESHLAYPMLFFFRSSHDNEAWLNSFGAVMDAAVLMMTTVEGGPDGLARMFFKVGSHLVEDFGWYFELPDGREVGVERGEFEQAREQLAAAGYQVRAGDSAWEDFVNLRSVYAAPLNQLAHYLAIIPAQWIGDRSYLPHRDGSRRRPLRARLRG
jgi:Ion channel